VLAIRQLASWNLSHHMNPQASSSLHLSTSNILIPVHYCWLYRCFVIKHYAMKAYGGVELQISALDGGESCHEPAALYQRTGHRYPLYNGLGGPGAGLDAMEKRKIS
jgi:hypothetical protein